MDLKSPDWDWIVQTHGPMAFETAWRMLGHAADTEDVVQEAFLDALEVYRRQAINNWGGLLRHLAIRRAIDRVRKRRGSAPLPPKSPAFDVALPESQGPESEAVARELAERLRTAVGELSDREGSVFSLYYFGDMANHEIAQVLDISVDAVGVALYKARQKLKRILGLEEVGSRRSRS